MTSGTLHVEHMRMEMVKIFQEVDRLGGTRAGMEREGHLVSQSAIGIAFRAMKIDTPPNVPTRVMREDKAVVTPIGAILRKTSIEELSQLVNIDKGDIPLCILKKRPEFSEKSMGAFALPAKSSTNKGKVFSQVVSCFASGLRVCRAASSNFNLADAAEVGFLAKPIFGAVCA